MAARAARKVPKKKGGYQMPEAIPAGEILMDISKGRWILGKSIGTGGFGEVYSAAPYLEKISKDYPNVIKIEPHGNGPLFVEMHFYMRNCKPDDIDSWRKKKKLAALGIPRYIASGSHEYKNTKYRFLVIDRYGKDLWKIFEENNRLFPENIVYKLALQIIDILEYIHHKNYVHADIKGENLLLDLKSYDQVYLVDFGLASRCTKNTELKVDPKKAHNGTLQYTSRDAHMGVPTQRGDIEILSYNMILWLSGSLPWEKLLDKVVVQKEKEKAFENIDSFLNKCFHGSVPQAMSKFMALLVGIKFNEKPSYEKFKDILITGLKKQGQKPDGKLGLKTISTQIQQNPSRSTPQKVKKLADRVKKSPNIKPVAISTSLKATSRDSTIGVLIDKKHGNKKDIKKILNDIDPDGEYDIKIVHKKKKTESNEMSTVVENAVPLNNRRKIRINYNENDTENDTESDSEREPLSKRLHKPRPKKPIISKTRRKLQPLDDSETASEPEVLSKKTKARSATTLRGKITTKVTLPSRSILPESESEEDIFDCFPN